MLLGLLFVSPWLIGFSLFTIYPMVSSFYLSFQRYDLLRPPTFIGIENYVEMVTEPKFATVVYNTLFYVALSAPLGVASAFLIANLLNTSIIGRSFFRAIFFFPSIVPGVVTAMVWLYLLNTQYGAIGGVLQIAGLPAVPFLSSPALAKPSLIMIHMWGQGSATVIFLAALQDVPRSLYEAAMIDGANAWHRFRSVTIPMCTPVILFNMVMAFIAGFQEFMFPYLLTNGGPSSATEFYTLHLYRNAFQYLRMGKASALGWLLFAVIIVFTVLFFKSSARWVYYGGER